MRIPSLKDITTSFVFKRFLKRAGGIVAKPYLIYNVAKESLEKSGKDSSLRGMAEEGIASVGRLARLIKAYAAGDYRGVSKKNIILVVAGLLYFVSPLDLIPDALPFVGFLDDITIIGFVLSSLGDELLKFEEHEEGAASGVATANADVTASGTASSGTVADLAERDMISGDSVASPIDA